MNNKKLLKYLSILSLLLLTGCDLDTEYSDYDEVYDGNDNTSSSSNTASCPAGTTSPYNDPQFDTQCETACSYLSSGNKAASEIICETLLTYEIIDVIASDCGACGNTSSSSSNSGSSPSNSSSNTESIIWNLCTRKTSTHVYTQCIPYNGSCESGYNFYESYQDRGSCADGAQDWLNQYRTSSN